MNSFACRAFQCCFGAGARLLPWRTPEVYTGDGSLLRVADILRENSLRRPFVIASRRQCADEHFRRLQEVLDMQDILEADGKYKQVHIDDSFYLKDGALDKIQVYLHSQQIDVLILDQDVFEEFAGYGYFQSLDELAGEDLAEKYDTDYVYAAGYRDTDEVSFEDHETGQGAICVRQ